MERQKRLDEVSLNLDENYRGISTVFSLYDHVLSRIVSKCHELSNIWQIARSMKSNSPCIPL